VRRDEPTKRLVFLCGVSAFTEEPFNVFMRGPSSIGKSFLIKHSLKFFNPSRVWYLGGLSPTSIYHEYGFWEDDEGVIDITSVKTRDELREVKERLRSARYVVDMQNRIIAFLESPHVETILRLRPLLSHDVWETQYKFTNKEMGLMTSTVNVRGWPAAVFATTEAKYVEEMTTRGFTVTPEMSEIKYREALEVIAREMERPIRLSRREREIQLYLSAITEEMRGVLIPFASALAERYPYTLPRDMRDFKRILIALRCLTSVRKNMRYRVLLKADGETGAGAGPKEYLLATLDDLAELQSILEYVEETTRRGLPMNILLFYKNVLLPMAKADGAPLDYEKIAYKFSEVFERRVTKDTIRLNYIEPLRTAGLVDVEPDPSDRRKNRVEVLVLEDMPVTKALLDIRLSEEKFRDWVAMLREEGFEVEFRRPSGEPCDWTEAYGSVSGAASK
jgi:hypothetical protein